MYVNTRLMLTSMWLNLQVQHITIPSSFIHTTHTHIEAAARVGDTHVASLSAA